VNEVAEQQNTRILEYLGQDKEDRDKRLNAGIQRFQGDDFRTCVRAQYTYSGRSCFEVSWRLEINDWLELEFHSFVDSESGIKRPEHIRLSAGLASWRPLDENIVQKSTDR
jgi:hypothetical protein